MFLYCFLSANFATRELLFNGPNGLILSTDDYFAHRDGYHYDPGRLGEAHEWNQSRGISISSDLVFSCDCSVNALGSVFSSQMYLPLTLLCVNVYPLSAENAMRDGRSPIIIDNTNLQAWEMKPYVRMVNI